MPGTVFYVPQSALHYIRIQMRVCRCVGACGCALNEMLAKTDYIRFLVVMPENIIMIALFTHSYCLLSAIELLI